MRISLTRSAYLGSARHTVYGILMSQGVDVVVVAIVQIRETDVRVPWAREVNRAWRRERGRNGRREVSRGIEKRGRVRARQKNNRKASFKYSAWSLSAIVINRAVIHHRMTYVNVYPSTDACDSSDSAVPFCDVKYFLYECRANMDETRER